MKNKRIIAAALALLLCVALCLSSCSSGEKTLMSLEGKTLSVNIYQLLLTRMKGTLEYYGYDVSSGEFWRQIISSDGETLDEYFCAEILEQAKNYIVADYLFDKEGLSLDEERVGEVDKLLSDMEKSLGSRSALNGELKKYGVNRDMLYEVYLLEAKIDVLRDHFYGEGGEKIAAEIKEEYFAENYVAFGQIFLASYYTEVGKDGSETAVYYSDEDIALIEKKAYEYVSECNGDIDRFIEYASLYDEAEGSGNAMYLKVDEGYYSGKSSSAAYLDKIATAASELDVGQCDVVATDFGYHVIFKYESEAGAYDSESFADVFADFDSELITLLFEEKCAEYKGLITVNGEILESAPTMASVESNKLY